MSAQGGDLMMNQMLVLQQELEKEKKSKADLLAKPEFASDEAIRMFDEKEKNAQAMVASMKLRLKEALEDKKEFEIEMLALKRNFLKAKNKAKQLEQTGAGGPEGLMKDLEKTKSELDEAKQKLA